MRVTMSRSMPGAAGITIGVDAHKRVHAAVAVDSQGQVLTAWRGPNTPAGWREVAAWAEQLAAAQDRAADTSPVLMWGIEGAWQYGRGLAQHLVADGAAVVDVNPRWTAGMRRGSRRPGKNDRLDAQAVAWVVQREARLPRVPVEDESAVAAVLAAEREALVAEQTQLRNRLHQLLTQLDPAYDERVGDLTRAAGVARVLAWEQPADVLTATRLAAAQRLAGRLQLAMEQTTAVTEQLEQIGRRHYAPLLALCGVGPLTAGTLAGLLGPGQRFATDAQLAAYAGVAPLEASSGERVRHRLNRGGKRQLNAIAERMALTQARCHPPAQAYLARKRAEGKTAREARRCLKRYLIRAIWHAWQQCEPIPLT
jgi:transposase